ncbi:hypothetical protein [Hoylesella saccharolytica]|uniref:hypothetical protein n=1 Tax=Hoylesella saccharolytica TaxID=633701 RepID=UPI0028EF87B6|nr:hypothetical protein [Hoylesella saccharolytica]
MVRKTMFTVCALLVLSASSVYAQDDKTSENGSLSEKVSELVKKTKTSMEKAGQRISKVIGIDEKNRKHSDNVKIDGTYYMRLYSKNIYTGKEAKKFRKACEDVFMKKYPNAVITSVAIPQDGWLSETVKSGSKIVGYEQTMYCYIIAKDGGDGYINARFSFQQYKDVGKAYESIEGKWPQWDRTDVLTPAIYNELLNK